MRLPFAAVAAGVFVTVLGAAGLVRAAVPQGAAGSGGLTTDTAPIVVTGAYIRPPVPPTKTAAAYFVVRNTTNEPDVLQSVITGAGSTAALHTIQPDGSMAVAATGVTIPAHGTLRLSPGTGHVMIEGIYGKLTGGQTVNMTLQFRDAGPIEVTATVVPFGQSPTAASSSGTSSSSTSSSTPATPPATPSSTPSGAHS